MRKSSNVRPLTGPAWSWRSRSATESCCSYMEEDFCGRSIVMSVRFIFFFSSRRRHTRCSRDWSSDVCSSDLLNIALNRNKVLDLGPDSILVGAYCCVGGGAHQNPTVLKVGEPINSFYGWVYAGMKNGQPVYKNLDGDTAITSADRTIIGNAQPRYTGGLSNRFTFRNFELSLFLQWSVGNKIYNINRSLLTAAGGKANQLADVRNGGPAIPAPKIGNTFESTESNLFVEDGSYLRGKNLRLSYSVPASWLRAMHVQSMSRLELYVSAQNFFTITKYTGYDPEISEYANTNLAQGIDFGTYPQVRQITFGFTAGF